MATGTRPAVFADDPEALDGGDALRALLADYAELLDRVEDAPTVVSVRPVRWAWLPAPRSLVRLLAVRHVGRRVEALRRRSCARAAIAPRGANDPPDELTRLDHFARALPGVPGMKLLGLLGVLVLLLIAYVLANHVIGAEAAALLGDLTTAALELDRGAVVEAFDRNAMEARFFVGAAVLLLWSAVLLIAPALPAFSVLRRLRREQRDLEHHEASAFTELGARRVHDLQLDLVAQFLLVAAICVESMWLFVGPVIDPAGDYEAAPVIGVRRVRHGRHGRCLRRPAAPIPRPPE
jgi:hypothetical protein